MKPIKNFILVVDTHRRPSRMRNTHGRYRVGAKTAEEAVKLLREKIGFGSIRVLCEARPGYSYSMPFVPYKKVVQEVRDHSKPGASFKYVEPHHATAPRSTYINDGDE